MSWADQHIANLKKGAVSFTPRGHSMTGMINDGQLVTVMPVGWCDEAKLEVGRAVLVKLGGRVLLHKVTALGSDGRVQISNNKGHVNGWAQRKDVYGVVISVR